MAESSLGLEKRSLLIKLAKGDVPAGVVSAVRLGRMTALTKPNGRVRGPVMGDVFRQLVARSMA